MKLPEFLFGRDTHFFIWTQMLHLMWAMYGGVIVCAEFLSYLLVGNLRTLSEPLLTVWVVPLFFYPSIWIFTHNNIVYRNSSGSDIVTVYKYKPYLFNNFLYFESCGNSLTRIRLRNKPGEDQKAWDLRFIV